jgi:hypothetical protein
LALKSEITKRIPTCWNWKHTPTFHSQILEFESSTTFHSNISIRDLTASHGNHDKWRGQLQQ